MVVDVAMGFEVAMEFVVGLNVFGFIICGFIICGTAMMRTFLVSWLLTHAVIERIGLFTCINCKKG